MEQSSIALLFCNSERMWGGSPQLNSNSQSLFKGSDGTVCDEVEKGAREVGEKEKWELGSVKHGYKALPSLFYGLQRAIWSRCPVKRAFSCQGAANLASAPAKPQRALCSTDTQHMCPLAGAPGK